MAYAPTVSSECIVAGTLSRIIGSNHDSVTVAYECSLDKKKGENQIKQKKTTGNNELPKLVERVGGIGGGEGAFP